MIVDKLCLGRVVRFQGMNMQPKAWKEIVVHDYIGCHRY